MKFFRVLLLVFLSTSVLYSADRERDLEFDIVVYGGTSGGVAAAVQAKRMGKTVALIEPTRRLCGLTTGGLGQTDIGNKMVIGYTAHPNRATNVPVIVSDANGQTRFSVNQPENPAIAGMFVSLGVFRFEADEAYSVEVRNEKTDGCVIVDAVNLIEK